MINSVVLTGRLTKELTLQYTQSGIPFIRFNLAVNRTFSNQQGDREADFPSCIAWRKQAENMAKFMTKGSMIGVTGRIQTGSYVGNDGKKNYTTDIVAEQVAFLETKNTRNDSSQAPPPQTHYTPPSGGTNAYGFGDSAATQGDPFSGTPKDKDLPF